MTQFKEGDQVRLKSGGPVLTVDEARGDGIVTVVWFGGDECHRDLFHQDALVSALSAEQNTVARNLSRG